MSCIDCKFVKTCDKVKNELTAFGSCKYRDIMELRDLIARGEELERQGYDCNLMNAMNKSLLADLEAAL